MQTAVVGASTVSIKTETADGVATTPSVVTVAGTAHDGTAVTLSAVTIGSGATLGTHTATLTVLVPTLVTLTWTVDGAVFTDPVDVIGRMPISVSDLRASDTSLANATTYPGSALRDAIELAHDEARRITGRSWVRRYDVFTTIVRGGRIFAPYSDIARVGAVTVDNVPWTAQQITDSAKIFAQSGVVQLGGIYAYAYGYESFGGTLPSVLGVEHGQREPSPQVRYALLVRARQWAQAATSKIPLYSERVVMDGNGGSIVRMLPGQSKTGVAEIDAIYAGAAWVGGVGFA